MEKQQKEAWNLQDIEQDRQVREWCSHYFFDLLERIHMNGNGASFFHCCMTFVRRNKISLHGHERETMSSYGQFKYTHGIQSATDLFSVLRNIAVLRDAERLPIYIPSIDAEHESKADLKTRINTLESQVIQLQASLEKTLEQLRFAEKRVESLESDLRESQEDGERFKLFGERSADRLNGMADKWYLSVQAATQNKRVVMKILERVESCAKCSGPVHKLSKYIREAPKK